MTSNEPVNRNLVVLDLLVCSLVLLMKKQMVLLGCVIDCKQDDEGKEGKEAFVVMNNVDLQEWREKEKDLDGDTSVLRN